MEYPAVLCKTFLRVEDRSSVIRMDQQSDHPKQRRKNDEPECGKDHIRALEKLLLHGQPRFLSRYSGVSNIWTFSALVSMMSEIFGEQ